MKKLMTVVVSALCAAVAFGAFASDVYVDAVNGWDGNPGTADEPFQSLSQVVASGKVADGAVIHFLAAGEYPVAATLDLSGLRDVTLVGEVKGATVIPGSEDIAGTLVTMTGAANITVRNVEFSGAKKGAFSAYTTSGLLVDGCGFHDNAGDSGAAMFLRNVTGSTVCNTLFATNTASGSCGGLMASNVKTALAGDLVVSNCVFIGNSAAGTKGGVALNAHMHQCTVVQCLVTRNYGPSSAVALWNDASTSYSARQYLYDSTIVDNGTPYGFFNVSPSAYIRNSVIDGAPYVIHGRNDMAAPVAQADTYWNCDFHPSWIVEKFGALRKTTDFAPRLDIDGRAPADSPAFGHGYTFPADAPVTARRDVYVDPAAASGDGTAGAPWPTLKAALDDVRDGDRIHLAAGTYVRSDDEPLAYELSGRLGVEILGEGAGAVFDGESAGVTTTFLRATDATRLVVSNLTLRNFTYNDFTANASALGFYLSRCASARMRDVRFEQCAVADTTAATTARSLYGLLVSVRNQTALDMRRCSATDCLFDGSAAGKAHNVFGFFGGRDSWLKIRECDFVRLKFKSTAATATLWGVCNVRGYTSENTGLVGDVHVRSCRFLDCGRTAGETDAGVVYLADAYSVYEGGAWRYDNANVYEYCTFLGGRGRYAGSGGTLQFYNCVFHGCGYDTDNATDEPGRFYGHDQWTSAKFSFTSCQFDSEVSDLISAAPSMKTPTLTQSGSQTGDPFVDAAGVPQVSGNDVSPLVDTAAALTWQGYVDDTDLLGNVRVKAYLDKTAPIPDRGCYEIAPPVFRLVTEDVQVRFDGNAHGPSYAITRYDETVELDITFSEAGETGPFCADEPAYVEAGVYPVWVRVSGGGQTEILRSTLTIIRSISGDAYLAPDGTGDGSAPDRPSADVQRVVDATLENSTIHFAPGVYRLPTPVNLSGRANLVLDGAGLAVLEPDESCNETLVRLSGATNVVLRGLTVRRANRVQAYLAPDEPGQLKDIDDNITIGAFGGGLYAACAVDCVVEDCAFVTNRCAGGATAEVTLGGAAMLYRSTNCVFRRCDFDGNAVDAAGGVRAGGALFLFETVNCTVEDSYFHRNEATDYGCAIAEAHADFTVTNALVAGNFRGNAAIETPYTATSSSPDDPKRLVRLSRVTVADNVCGFGAYFGGSVKWRIEDSVVSGQRYPYGYDKDRNSGVVANSWFFGDQVSSGTTQKRAEKDPKLTHACVPEAGSGADLAAAGWRPTAAFAPVIGMRDVYVDPAAAAGGDGSAAAPYGTLRAAMDALRSGDTVHLAPGTYAKGGDETFEYGITNLERIAIVCDGGTAVFDGGTAESSRAFLRAHRVAGLRLANLAFENITLRLGATPDCVGLAFTTVGGAWIENLAFRNNVLVQGADCPAVTLNGGLASLSANSQADIVNLVAEDNVYDATESARAADVYGLVLYSKDSNVQVLGARLAGDVIRTAVAGSTVWGLLTDMTEPVHGIFRGRQDVRSALITDCGRGEGSVGHVAIIWKLWNGYVYYDNCTIAGNRAVMSASNANGAGYFYNCVFGENADGCFGSFYGDKVQGQPRLYNCCFTTDVNDIPCTDTFWAKNGVTLAPYSNQSPIHFDEQDPMFSPRGVCKPLRGSPLVDSGASRNWADAYAALDVEGRPRVDYGVKPPRKNPPAPIIDRGCYELPRLVPGLMLLVK